MLLSSNFNKFSTFNLKYIIIDNKLSSGLIAVNRQEIIKEKKKLIYSLVY